MFKYLRELVMGDKKEQDIEKEVDTKVEMEENILKIELTGFPKEVDMFLMEGGLEHRAYLKEDNSVYIRSNIDELGNSRVEMIISDKKRDIVVELTEKQFDDLINKNKLKCDEIEFKNYMLTDGNVLGVKRVNGGKVEGKIVFNSEVDVNNWEYTEELKEYIK